MRRCTKELFECLCCVVSSSWALLWAWKLKCTAKSSSRRHVQWEKGRGMILMHALCISSRRFCTTWAPDAFRIGQGLAILIVNADRVADSRKREGCGWKFWFRRVCTYDSCMKKLERTVLGFVVGFRAEISRSWFSLRDYLMRREVWSVMLDT